MPIYLYRCAKCGYEDEIEHAMNDSYEGVTCNGILTRQGPDEGECRGALRKVFTAPGIILRGKGWGKDA